MIKFITMPKRKADNTGTSPYFKKKSNRLTFADLSKPCVDLSKFLLGKSLCRLTPGTEETLRAKIVEVEAYPGHSDGASHSFLKKTERNKAMFMAAGTVYVYSIYGMYHCFNISSEGEGAAVLIRALEPVSGLDTMRANREAKRKVKSVRKPMKDKDLCSGPSKLCQAYNINKDLNCLDLSDSEEIWLEDGDTVTEDNMVNSTRIGIEGAGPEWSQLKLRWYILDNKNVSVRDKFAESVLRNQVT